MTSFNINKLSNGIKVITRVNKKTPRTAIFIGFNSEEQKKPGTSTLMARLLNQGTKTRNAEVLARELDENAIDVSVSAKQDYAKINALFLNEDFDKALELIEDILLNSTFEEFDKEVAKMKGEILVHMDSPKSKAFDNLIKNMYPNHPYGYTNTIILENLEKITKNDVVDFYKSAFIEQYKNITVVGDFDESEVLAKLEKVFSSLKCKEYYQKISKPSDLVDDIVLKIEKEDSAQAQVIQGWILPDISDKDFAAITVMNTILGSAGLSSRLFLELRDKKGLAYHVRSTYEAMAGCGTYYVYIGTNPENIKTSLDGFKEEIRKLQDIPVCAEELESAKKNYLGKRTFSHETNNTQANYLGNYDILGVGVDFDEQIVDCIKKVSIEDVQRVAKTYLSQKSVTSLLAPKKNLDTI